MTPALSGQPANGDREEIQVRQVHRVQRETPGQQARQAHRDRKEKQVWLAR